MEPIRHTEGRLLAVQAELRGLEPIVHHTALGTSHETYEAGTEVNFWEIGASGWK